MKSIFLKVIFMLLPALGVANLQAQEVLSVSGSNATGAGGSSSYSVGQLVFSHKAGAAGSVTEGVQQPYEIQVITGLEDARDIALSFSAYPNPTINYLTLKADNVDLSDLRYQLYNLNGQRMIVVESMMSPGNNTMDIPSGIPAGMYLLRIRSGERVETIKLLIR